MDTLELIRTYLAVVDSDSFTRAGRKLGKSKALVSKHVSELEARLGARLLNRTTRSIGITEIGRAYYDRAQQILADFDGLEEEIRSQADSPRGTLKLTAPQTLGELAIMELTTAYRRRYPAVSIDILLADRVVDLIAEGFDIALRVATLTDGSLIARKLCDARLLLCAAPAYLKRVGTPKSPHELAGHQCIVDTNIRWRDIWKFERNGRPVTVKIQSTVSVNSAMAVRDALVSGSGIGFCPEFAVSRDIAEGRLTTLFDEYAMPPYGVYLVYPHRNHLSAKVRSFIDFTVDWFTPQPPWLRSATP